MKEKNKQKPLKSLVIFGAGVTLGYLFCRMARATSSQLAPTIAQSPLKLLP